MALPRTIRLAALLLACPVSFAAASGKLDFQFFVTRVEPIFLQAREGGARCYNCHSLDSNHAIFHLQKLGPDGRWTARQSRANFENVTRLVTPGEPLQSRLLTHPLAPEAGGDEFHTGGKFWSSQQDPEWQTLAAWVNGAGAARPRGKSQRANPAPNPR